MPKTHPDERTLEKFARGKMARRDNIKVAWHLFNCAACRKEVEGLAAEGSNLLETLFDGLEPVDVADTPTYERAFSYGHSALEVRGEARDRDRARAPKLFAELMRHPVSRQRSLIQRTWRFKNYVFAEYLLDTSQSAVVDEPSRAEDLATLALSVADQLEGTHYGPALVADLKARAWAYVGNARRVQSDLRNADEAFAQADQWLAQGTDDVLLRARLQVLKASQRIDQRRFDEARSLFESALASYREAGESHQIGRTLLAYCTLLLETGEPDKGVEVLAEAEKLLDAKKDPRLLALLKKHQVSCLVEGGKFQEAKKLLTEARKAVTDHGTETDMIRLSWLEGRILQGLNRPTEAEKVFGRIRDQFVERGVAYDAALAALDLAAVYASQGRTSQMKTLAEEMLPIFRSRDVHREATAALLVFQKAAQAETATLQMVHEIANFLRAARKDPELQFKAS